MGWQGLHTNFVASYARAVTSGSGLAGVFQSNSAYVSARWKLARTWSLQAVASYTINKDISPSYFPSSSGGHRTFGSRLGPAPTQRALRGWNLDIPTCNSSTAVSQRSATRLTSVAGPSPSAITFPGRWEDNHARSSSMNRNQNRLTCSATWTWCAAATPIS